MQAHCSKREGEIDDAIDQLQKMVEKLEEMSSSVVRDNALCYVQLHGAVLEQMETGAEETAQILQQKLPDSIRSGKAVVATLASIYHKQGKEVEAEQLLRENGDAEALADFAMSQGKYEEAASLYEKAVKAGNGESSSDHVALARWVHALSYVDPEQAQQRWSEATPELVDDTSQHVDGAELEERELPRLKTSKHERTKSLHWRMRRKRQRRKVMRLFCEEELEDAKNIFQS